MFTLVVLSVAFAAVAANPITFWANGFTRPLASSWNAPLAAGAAIPLAAPIFNSVVAVGSGPPVGTLNYRGPLSLAPGQPANILAADGRPLDTLSVNLDRAAHNSARVLEISSRRLKRSIAAAPLAAANLGTANLAANNWADANFAAANWARAGLVSGPLDVNALAAGLLGSGSSATPQNWIWIGHSPIVPVVAPAVAPLAVAALR